MGLASLNLLDLVEGTAKMVTVRLRERGAHLAISQALQEVGFAAAVLAQEAVSAQGGSRGVRAAARGAPAFGPRMRLVACERRSCVA